MKNAAIWNEMIRVACEEPGDQAYGVLQGAAIIRACMMDSIKVPDIIDIIHDYVRKEPIEDVRLGLMEAIRILQRINQKKIKAEKALTNGPESPIIRVVK